MLHPGLDAQRRFESGRRAGITTCVNIVAGVLVAYMGTMLIAAVCGSLEEHSRNGHNLVFGLGLFYGIPVLLISVLVVLALMIFLSDLPALREISARRMTTIALDIGSVWFLWIGPTLWFVYAVLTVVTFTNTPPFLYVPLLLIPLFPAVILPILWARAAMRGLIALNP